MKAAHEAQRFAPAEVLRHDASAGKTGVSNLNFYKCEKRLWSREDKSEQWARRFSLGMQWYRSQYLVSVPYPNPEYFTHTCEIHADTRTLTPVVYVRIQQFCHICACTAVKLATAIRVLEKHAEGCCSNNRTSVIHYSTKQVLVLYSLCEKVESVHPRFSPSRSLPYPMRNTDSTKQTGDKRRTCSVPTLPLMMYKASSSLSSLWD